MIHGITDGNGRRDTTSSYDKEASNQAYKYQHWAETYKPNHHSTVECSLSKSALSKPEMPLVYNTNVVKDVTIIQNTDPAYIWTLLSVPGFDGLSVSSGIEHDGYLGFLITEVPHKGMPIKVNLPRSIKEALAK